MRLRDHPVVGEGAAVPFDDELSPGRVTIAGYRDQWPMEAAELAGILRRAVPLAVAVEHIGSTSIPGMAGKDCLDMMIIVEDLLTSQADSGLGSLGFRRRPEPWNNIEEAGGKNWPKMVFAPPAGGRPVNIHVRTTGSATARLSLLFRDHLRANPARTRWWSELKAEAATAAVDLAGYGRIKYPAWCLLMELAEAWARDTRWEPPAYGR